MQEILDAIGNGSHTEAAAAIAGYNSDINGNLIIWCSGILLYAVIYDSVPAIEALAARGDVEFQRKTCGDPVLLAVTRPATLRALLRCFPDIDVNRRMTGYRSESALAHAAFFGIVESVQLLLDVGAEKRHVVVGMKQLRR